jgi:putative alpha-1,2-mannosidase
VWIAHGEVAGGGTIRFELSHQPANWAKGVPPPSPMESRP